MKRACKFLLCFVMVVAIGMFVSKTFAEEKLKVVEVVQEYDYSYVLYSNGQFYYWDSDSSGKIDNVKEIIYNDWIWDEFYFLDNDNNLKILFTDNFGILDVTSNIKDGDGYYFLTMDGELYQYYVDESILHKTLMMNDVKSYENYGNSLLILGEDGSLYGYGDNVFGKKINDGENITDRPIILSENVIEFGLNYYITENNDLYLIKSSLAYPTKITSGVTKVVDSVIDYSNFVYIKDGKTYEYYYSIDGLGNISAKENKLLLDLEVVSCNYYYCLTKDGDLYNFDIDIKKLIDTDVKQIFGNMYLKSNGELYDYYYEYSYYRFGNVSKIVNDELFIMNDGTIMTKGNNIYYDIGNYGGTTPTEYKNYITIKGLPNVPSVIQPYEVILNHSNMTEFTVGERFDYYVNVYPYNSENKDLTWSSSNEEVVTVTDNGTLNFVGEGSATIKVKLDNYNLSDEIEVVVYPKVTGIEIVNGDNVSFNKNDYLLLDVKFLPENTLEQDIILTSDAGTFEEIDGSIQDIIYFNRKYCYDSSCEKIQIRVYARKVGKYTITARTEDGLYSDSIVVEVVQDVTDIDINPDINNFLANTLYMYLKESNEMDLNVKVYPDDATNKNVIYTSSDDSIATVDSTGKVTAYKSGKVTITMKSESGDVDRTINILIFGNDVSTKIGDVDGDGEVDILDLVKLRRYLAGSEDLQ